MILSLFFLALLDHWQSMPLLYGTLVSSPTKVPPWKRACRIIMGRQYTTYVDALEVCNLDTLHARREQLSLNFFKSLMKSEHFSSWIPHSRGSVHQRNLRNSNKLSIPRCNTTRCKNSPMVYMTDLWNNKG